MLDVRSRLARRVSIFHHDGLTIVIRRRNDYRASLFILIFFTAIFCVFVSVLGPPLLRVRSVRETLYVLPFVAFVAVWYFLALRIGIWRAFGETEIVVRSGVFRWTRTALFWTRCFEENQQDIVNITAKTSPWLYLGSSVEFNFKGRTFGIADGILSDEAAEIVAKLTEATGH
ncbi:MAG: hypothetical protein WCC87_25170 [Candidatus Korobacteraceae bacterium]